jgi:hypothetical protein
VAVLGFAILAFAVALIALHIRRPSTSSRSAYSRLSGLGAFGLAFVISGAAPTLAGVLVIIAGVLAVTGLVFAVLDRRDAQGRSS